MHRPPLRLAAVLLSVPLAVGAVAGPSLAQSSPGAASGPAAPGRDPFLPLITAPGGESATGGAASPDPDASSPGPSSSRDTSVPGGSGVAPLTELPRTGPRTGPLAAVTALLLLAGGVLVRAGARRPGLSSPLP
jgi:hypothetical protein